MVYQLAWKNIGRNRVRTAVMLCSIILGMTVAVLLVAFQNGLMNQKIDAF